MCVCTYFLLSKAICQTKIFSPSKNSFKKNIERKDSKQLVKKLINSKKVRKQIIKLKQDIDKPDFGRK